MPLTESTLTTYGRACLYNRPWVLYVNQGISLAFTISTLDVIIDADVTRPARNTHTRVTLTCLWHRLHWPYSRMPVGTH